MKKYGLHILLCLAVLAVFARPFPVCASGSGSSRVTVDIEESDLPQEPESEEIPESTPEPGDTETPPETDDESNPEEESGGTDSTPEPGEETRPTEASGGDDGSPESGENPAPAGEPGEPESTPEQEKEPDERDTGRNQGLSFLIAAGLIIGGIAVGVLAGWLFHFLGKLLKSRRNRKGKGQFHGILTEKKNPMVRFQNVTESSRLVQDIIDGAGSLQECRAEVLKETALTCIPTDSRMRFSYLDEDGKAMKVEKAADEAGMFRILESLEGAGEVEVRIFCKRAGIDISLKFQV